MIDHLGIPVKDYAESESFYLRALAPLGIGAAIANPVFHATGVRVRELPVRVDKLMG